MCIRDSYNSAEMTLEQVLDTIRAAEKAGGTTVRLHTGDPCLYGAIREQMDALDADGIPYDDTPGVSSFCGAAAALCAEYTLPNVSQTVIDVYKRQAVGRPNSIFRFISRRSEVFSLNSLA